MRGKANPAIWLLYVIVAAAAGPADGAGQMRTCVFDSSRSTVLQNSEITGVQIRYSVKGWFRLTLDPGAGAASFDQVDAGLLDDEGNMHISSLNQVFNITGLTGTVIDDATMEFVGTNVGRTPADVRLRLTLADGSARLTGQVTPPPNGADRTSYELEAYATVSTKYGGGTGGPGEILFRFDADGEIISTPSIADDGTIYFGTLNATLYAIDGSGSLKWQWKYDCERYCPQAFESSPAIGDDGTIYVADDIAIPNYLFAITPDGRKKWEYWTNVIYGSMDASPVLLSDGTIFAGGQGFSRGSGLFGQLVALTPDGTVLDGFPFRTGAIVASPVAVGDVAVVGETAGYEGCNEVFAVKKSRDIVWRTELCDTWDTSKWFSLSSLAVDGNDNVFVAQNVQVFFPKTGPPLAESVLFQLDSLTGEKFWQTKVTDQSIVVGSPVVDAAGQDTNVIVATENGHVISFGLHADGARLNYDLTLGENSVAAGTPVVGDNGKLYHAVNSTNDANQIDVFEINADGTISESFHVLILNDHVLSSLSMDNEGVIYFGTEAGKLYAVQTGAGGLSKTAPWPTFRHDRKNTGNSEGPFAKAPSPGTSTYVLLPDRSTLVRSGGIGGIQRTYTLTGTFSLTLDFEAGTASFARVDANAVDDTPDHNTLNPNDVFRLTELAGVIVDGTTIQFKGTADNESSILLTLTFADDIVLIEGRTIPPPHSADFFVFNLDAVAQRKYAGGSGTAADPYLISTPEQMNAIGAEPNDWDKHFKLMADIDLSRLKGTAFNVIGYLRAWNDRAPFTGVFDGNTHTISGFTYLSSGVDRVGLFGCVAGSGAEIKNLGLIDPNIDAGTGRFVGLLVGQFQGGTISGCFVQGGTVVGGQDVGGIVGYSEGTIAGCYANANIIGIERVGSLVGFNESGTLSGCYSTGNVLGEKTIGGLAGQNGLYGSHRGEGFYVSGNIDNCYSTCDVIGVAQLGGLVGSNCVGSIAYCYSAGAVDGKEQAGGLVGHNDAIITDCFWDIETSGLTVSAGGTGKTTTEMQDPDTFKDAGWAFTPHDVWFEPEGGGYPILWWQLPPSFRLPAFSGGTGEPGDPYLISTAEELNRIDYNPRLMKCYFKLVKSLDLTGFRFNPIGGQGFPYVGTFDGNGRTISHLTLDGEEHLGLFGKLGPEALVEDLGVVDVRITGSGNYLGGLAGRIGGSSSKPGAVVTHCYSTGVVSGGESVGGLIGYNDRGILTQCYSAAAVSGKGFIGGLIGRGRYGSMIHCYSVGAVSTCSYAGGLVGHNDASPTRRYSVAAVSGGSPSASGRLVGLDYDFNYGEVIESFWDITTSGRIRSAGGTGKTTAEMQTAGTFLDAGWDFVGEVANGTDDIWWIDEGRDYPRLWWQAGGN